MIYLAIGNAIFMLGYIIGKICAAYEHNKTRKRYELENSNY